MTAPDYVAQVAELLSKHRPRGFSLRDECSCGWSIPDRAGWADRRAHDLHVAEVLAAAGLIPTRTEWGVREVATGLVYDHHDGWTEDDARTHAAVDRELTLISRPAHDWKDVTDD